MSKLKNDRHERFARALAQGDTADEAYAKARYRAHRGNAARLRANENIQARVGEIQGRAAERAEITIADVLAELAKIGFADMGTYIRFENGEPVLDFSALPDGATAVISEITQDVLQGRGDDPDTVKRTKFKLYDKRAALVDIGKHLGMFIDRLGGPDGGPIKIDAEIDERALARRIALILAKVDR